jgi:hypothetical protein
MKNLLRIIAIAIVLTGISFSSFAQVSATAHTTAWIVTTINLVKNVDMEFGNLAVTGTAGTCILSPASVRTPGGGVTLPAITGTVSAAEFTVSGAPGYTYAITLPASVILTRVLGGGTPMTVDAFTSTPTPTGQIQAGGTQTLYVGATVNVNANQMAGEYHSANDFSVTVNYN